MHLYQNGTNNQPCTTYIAKSVVANPAIATRILQTAPIEHGDRAIERVLSTFSAANPKYVRSHILRFQSMSNLNLEFYAVVVILTQHLLHSFPNSKKKKGK